MRDDNFDAIRLGVEKDTTEWERRDEKSDGQEANSGTG